jgi:hypothetical protein
MLTRRSRRICSSQERKKGRPEAKARLPPYLYDPGSINHRGQGQNSDDVPCRTTGTSFLAVRRAGSLSTTAPPTPVCDVKNPSPATTSRLADAMARS